MLKLQSSVATIVPASHAILVVSDVEFAQRLTLAFDPALLGHVARSATHTVTRLKVGVSDTMIRITDPALPQAAGRASRVYPVTDFSQKASLRLGIPCIDIDAVCDIFPLSAPFRETKRLALPVQAIGVEGGTELQIRLTAGMFEDF